LSQRLWTVRRCMCKFTDIHVCVHVHLPNETRTISTNSMYLWKYTCIYMCIIEITHNVNISTVRENIYVYMYMYTHIYTKHKPKRTISNVLHLPYLKRIAIEENQYNPGTASNHVYCPWNCAYTYVCICIYTNQQKTQSELRIALTWPGTNHHCGNYCRFSTAETLIISNDSI